MRPITLPIALCLVCLWLCRCSLSLENPEQDARNKLAKVIPTTMAGLEGRWDADSTYTVDDIRATPLSLSGLQLEIFADTTLFAYDTTRLVFSATAKGRLRIAGDTLFTQPVPGSGAVPDTFVAKLRFLGNRLELDHPADQRFTFFHKRKPIDSTLRDSLLGDSLWLLKKRQVRPDSTHVEALRKDFSYLRFPRDSMYRDLHRDGIFSTDSGSLAKAGRKWTWKSPSGTREFYADLLNQDSLRLWSLVDGRPDSGFDVYTRMAGVHRFDLDVRPVLGHMRTDSIKVFRPVENHFGRFYDLIFGEDHSVVTQSNMDSLPRFQSWTLDSGFLWLQGPGGQGSGGAQARFSIDTGSSKVVKLTTDSNKFIPASTTFFQTKVDGSRFADHPLERFPQASYAHVVIGADTLRYYFSADCIKGSPDSCEIAHPDSGFTQWLTMNADAAQESFQSSQTGFWFAFQGTTQALGRFTCRALPDNDLVIRLTTTNDATLSQGLLQGQCRILVSAIPPADSNLDLGGTFRFKRKTVTNLASPLWPRP